MRRECLRRLSCAAPPITSGWKSFDFSERRRWRHATLFLVRSHHVMYPHGRLIAGAVTAGTSPLLSSSSVRCSWYKKCQIVKIGCVVVRETKPTCIVYFLCAPTINQPVFLCILSAKYGHSRLQKNKMATDIMPDLKLRNTHKPASGLTQSGGQTDSRQCH